MTHHIAICQKKHTYRQTNKEWKWHESLL